MPRFKKVTLKELIESLNKAITTENRRIKKEIINKNALRETGLSLPKRKFSIKDKIKEIYDKVFGHLEKEELKKRVSFSELLNGGDEEKIISFAPLLHLENQKKIWLEQEAHFEEIYIWLKDVYFKEKGDPFADLKTDIEEEIENLDEEALERLEELEEKFDNPIGE